MSQPVSVIAQMVDAVKRAQCAAVYELGLEILDILPPDLPERDLVKACILQKMDELSTDLPES